MNELIMSIFDGFTVDGVAIPVSFMFYEGHGEPYIVFSHEDNDNSFSADDELLKHVEYYDFDVYSKGNYLRIIESMKSILEANGFTWQVSKTSPDMYEPDTKYFHKTLNFAIIKED